MKLLAFIDVLGNSLHFDLVPVQAHDLGAYDRIAYKDCHLINASLTK